MSVSSRAPGYRKPWLAVLTSFGASMLAGASHAAVPALEEVVVTAQKRAESLQDTPISIAAFNESQMRAKGIDNLFDLENKVPSLRIQPHPNSANTAVVFIRGVGYLDDQITQDPAVAVYLDGVYLARSQGLSMEVADLERIEVLRGPQGSLYGRNATGGAINYISARPDLERVALTQDVTIGNRQARRSKTMLNLPLGDSVAVKLAYLHSQKDGFVRNLGTGKDRFGDERRRGARAELLWDVSPDLSVHYSYDWARVEDTPVYLQPANAHPQSTRRVTRGSPAVRNLKANDVKTSGHHLTVDWAISDTSQLKSITAYRELKNFQYQDYHSGLYSPEPFYITSNHSSQDQWSQELQWLGNMAQGQLEYIAGAYYFEEDASLRDDNVLIPSDSGISTGTADVTNKAVAVYGQATYHPPLLPRWSFTLGGRYTWDKREAYRHFDFETFSGMVIPGRIQQGRGNQRYSSFTPSLTVEYAATDDVNLYGKVVTGYKSGGFNIRASSTRTFEDGFDKEKVTSYELGVKSEFWQRRVRLNAAAFWADYDDIQTDVVSHPTNPSISDTLNAGKGRIRGAEMDLTLALLAGLDVQVSYAYLDAEYREIVDARGIDIKDTINYANAPRHAYNIDVNYRWASTPIGRPSVHVNYAWQDEVVSDRLPDAYGRDFIVDDYGLLNARAVLAEIPTGLPGTLEVALWARNIENRQYLRNTFSAGIMSGYAGEPRTYGIDLRYEF